MFSVIFPGQGSQSVGMAKELHSKFDLVKKYFKHADEVLDFPISKIILDELKTEIGPSEIIIKKEINKIGQFDINIVLHSEVQTKIFLKIEKLDKLQGK